MKKDEWLIISLVSSLSLSHCRWFRWIYCAITHTLCFARCLVETTTGGEEEKATEWPWRNCHRSSKVTAGDIKGKVDSNRSPNLLKYINNGLRETNDRKDTHHRKMRDECVRKAFLSLICTLIRRVWIDIRNWWPITRESTEWTTMNK